MKNKYDYGSFLTRALAILLVLSAASNSSAQELVVSYSFSDNRTDLAENDAGTPDGTVIGPGLEWITDGVSGGALRFSGAQAINTNLPNEVFGELAFFVCANNTVSNGNLINFRQFAGPQLRIAALDDGSVLFDTPAEGQYHITSPVYGSGYHCFTLTCDGHRCFAYADKGIEAELNYSGSFYSTIGCFVGARDSGGNYINEYISSDIDEVRVYRRNLTSLDVESLIDGFASTTTSTTEASATTTTEAVPSAPEFASFGIVLSLLLAAPGFAYLTAKRKR